MLFDAAYYTPQSVKIKALSCQKPCRILEKEKNRAIVWFRFSPWKPVNPQSEAVDLRKMTMNIIEFYCKDRFNP